MQVKSICSHINDEIHVNNSFWKEISLSDDSRVIHVFSQKLYPVDKPGIIHYIDTPGKPSYNTDLIFVRQY